MDGELLPGHELLPDAREVITEALVSCAATGALDALKPGPGYLEAAGADCGDANTADDGLSDEFACLLGRLPKRIRDRHELTHRQLKQVGEEKVARATNRRLGRPSDTALEFEEVRAIAGGEGEELPDTGHGRPSGATAQPERRSLLGGLVSV